jgi:hypothetical protein
MAAVSRRVFCIADRGVACRRTARDRDFIACSINLLG